MITKGKSYQITFDIPVGVVPNMKRYSAILMVTLLVLSFGVMSAVYAACPTYLTNLEVTSVNVTPSTISCGDTAAVTVHLQYPDGTPVSLSPETLTFKCVGSCSSFIFENVPVYPVPGKPGWYTWNLTVMCSTDICSAETSVTQYTIMTCYTTSTTIGDRTTVACNQTGPQGTYDIVVAECCAGDGLGNYGPTNDIYSFDTLDLEDNSVISIGSLTPKPPTAQELLATYGIPVLIAALIIIALALLAARARKKK